jgi:anaerobic selenocysteine-containing dehydrogenase
LKRVGERGNGKWERISWGEAIDAIATKLAEVVEKHGPKSIARSVAAVPLLRSAGYSRLVGLTKGTLVHNLGSGDLAGPTADIVTFGRLLGALWALVFEKPELAIV